MIIIFKTLMMTDGQAAVVRSMYQIAVNLLVSRKVTQNCQDIRIRNKKFINDINPRNWSLRLTRFQITMKKNGKMWETTFQILILTKLHQAYNYILKTCPQHMRYSNICELISYAFAYFAY
ncbi:hypothetical protein Zmor_014894 [Zophobas morio]|uniref:Uncharacterized protein n=1 Tax=Zophobas morio TaxID=2755281 RepID=A0AA38IKG8_9CUCU|nr:hypothetical protein Zmor_014894 [Zophobas morio]